MRTHFRLGIISILAILPLHGQYKATVSPPTAPGRVFSLSDGLAALRGIAAGAGVGQYNYQAAKMNTTDGSITYLDPGLAPSGRAFIYSEARGSEGNDTVGNGLDNDNSIYYNTCIHWDKNGVPTRYSITNAVWMATSCNTTYGGQAAGSVENFALYYNQQHVRHAALFTSPGTFIDLTSGGYVNAEVLGSYGGQQVGYQAKDFSTSTMAFLWHGGPGPINLHPSNYSSSAASVTNGIQQGGSATTVATATVPAQSHAMLWSGSAASAVDLAPPGFYDTSILGLNATNQVGTGWDQPANSPTGHGAQHALVWSGTANSVVDLNQYLPLGYSNAVATAIDASGNIAAYAWGQVGGQFQYIDVILVPQAPSPSQLLSVTVTPAVINQGDSFFGQVTLAGPAPAGGQVITLGNNIPPGTQLQSLIGLPPSVVVPEGQTSASFSGATDPTANLPSTANIRIYGNDGVVTRSAPLTVNGVPRLISLSIPSVTGGLSTTGSLTISAQASGGAIINLTSGNPSLLTVPATVSIPSSYPYLTMSFPVTTGAVAAVTTVQVTGVMGSSSITITVTLNPPAPAVLTGITVTPELVGGATYSGTVSFNNPANVAGATVSLVSDNPSIVPAPATVTATQGQTSVSFSGVTSSVTAKTTAHITATYNGVSLTATIIVDNAPPATIINAEYDTISLVFKIDATTTIPNSTLSFGTDPNLGPIGTMQFSSNVWSGKKNMSTAPSSATVWNSNGGFVTAPVTLRAK